MSDKLTEFSLTIGHSFSDASLFSLALIHRSSGSPNNERLEFLGDAILDVVIGEALYRKFPKATEGELSRLRANLVNGNSLAQMSKNLDVGEHLKLGVGERKSGGRKRTSILANTFEAIIGAVYLDSNFVQVEKVVLQLFQAELEAMQLGEKMKDPKTELQELLQARKKALPVYEVEKVTGEAHNQLFYVKCLVADYDRLSRGKSVSRRGAEQSAAELMLALLR